MKQVIVSLEYPGNPTKTYIDEDVSWTRDDGYLRIFYGGDRIAEFSPGTWRWVELTDAPQ